MARLKFGAFLAPHHPIGEHPMLQFRRDLDFVEQLDALGYDEFWCGEHHSSGWETIASPEMFLAAAGERTKRIKLGTGVVSLPYHHPFNVAQRMVQLDHMTGGRAIFGSGPGRAGLRRAYARHRSDDAARSSGRGHRDHPPAVQRRARDRQERLVHHERRRAANPAAAGRDAVRGGVADLAVGHDAGRQIRHRHHFARLDVDARPDGAADAMGICRGRGEEARHHRQPVELARAVELAHRRDPRTGARAKPAPDCCAGTTNTMSARCSGRGCRPSNRPRKPSSRPPAARPRRPPSAPRTIWSKPSRT